MDLSQKILKQLIQIKSYSGQEKELANWSKTESKG